MEQKAQLQRLAYAAARIGWGGIERARVSAQRVKMQWRGFRLAKFAESAPPRLNVQGRQFSALKGARNKKRPIRGVSLSVTAP